jgi:hypothetical protein
MQLGYIFLLFVWLGVQGLDIAAGVVSRHTYEKFDCFGVYGQIPQGICF